MGVRRKGPLHTWMSSRCSHVQMTSAFAVTWGAAISAEQRNWRNPHHMCAPTAPPNSCAAAATFPVSPTRPLYPFHRPSQANVGPAMLRSRHLGGDAWGRNVGVDVQALANAHHLGRSGGASDILGPLLAVGAGDGPL